jgi:hypothetical protein
MVSFKQYIVLTLLIVISLDQKLWALVRSSCSSLLSCLNHKRTNYSLIYTEARIWRTNRIPNQKMCQLLVFSPCKQASYLSKKDWLATLELCGPDMLDLAVTVTMNYLGVNS